MRKTARRVAAGYFLLGGDGHVTCSSFTIDKEQNRALSGCPDILLELLNVGDRLAIDFLVRPGNFRIGMQGIAMAAQGANGESVVGEFVAEFSAAIAAVSDGPCLCWSRDCVTTLITSLKRKRRRPSLALQVCIDTVS